MFSNSLRHTFFIAGWLLTAISCFSQDTLTIHPRWKLSSCELEHGSNKALDTLYSGFNPESEYLELVLIEYYNLNSSAIWTECRLQSLSEFLQHNGLEIDVLTPKTYYGKADDLHRLGKRGKLRTTYLVIHQKTAKPLTFGKP